VQYSIINYSKLDSIVFRIDAEYYMPDLLRLEKKIRDGKSKNIRNLNGKLDCSAFYPSITEYYDFAGNGVPFLRVNEIVNGLVRLNQDTAFLPLKVLIDNPTTISHASPGDIVIAKGGNSLGKVGLVTNKYTDYAFCRDLIVLRTTEITEINHYYLWVYLHSDIGQKLLLRTASQTGQPHLTLEAIYQLDIPIPNTLLQSQFEILYKDAQEFSKQSEELYYEAEAILLSELSLVNWQPKHTLSFVRNYSETEQAGRIDAEYFQPKYDEIAKAIKKYKGGWDILGNVVNIKDKNHKPKDKQAYKYIELANIAGNGEVTDCMLEEGQDLPSRARRKVAAGDVIISSIEGSLSSIALIEKEYDQSLCSTGFYVVNSKSFNSATLLVLLKSIAGQLQLKKGCSGTILTAINSDELKKLILPLIGEKAQTQIQQKIGESFDLRKQSKHLLECAKKAVELAIEKDEKTAMKWISEQTEIK